MIWFLPIIVIGGLFYPPLGYLVAIMMIFFTILSYFRGRYWCSNLCPRGAFLDIVLSKFSLKRKFPSLFISNTFRWTVFFLFMIFFIFQLVTAEKTFYAIGFVFVRMCILTTIISVVIGIPIHHRAWCSFCPMGTLQTKIATVGKSRRKETRPLT